MQCEGGQKREDKKEQMMMKKCVLTDEESKNIEHKRLRSALDDSAVENSRMRQEILANIVHTYILSFCCVAQPFPLQGLEVNILHSRGV